jgi:hypothetical protein
MEFSSFITTHDDAMAMIAALKATPLEVVVESRDTATATAPRAGVIFRAIWKGRSGPVIVRHVTNLFQ